jgi:hypothetical protein
VALAAGAPFVSLEAWAQPGRPWRLNVAISKELALRADRVIE